MPEAGRFQRDSAPLHGKVSSNSTHSSSSARTRFDSSVPRPAAAYTKTLISRNESTFMQFVPRPPCRPGSPFRPLTQPPDLSPGTAGVAGMRRQPRQILPHKSIDRRILLQSISPRPCQHLIVHTQGDLLHVDSSTKTAAERCSTRRGMDCPVWWCVTRSAANRRESGSGTARAPEHQLPAAAECGRPPDRPASAPPGSSSHPPASSPGCG